MRNRIKIILIALGIVVIVLVAWQWKQDWRGFSGGAYPGLVNQEVLDLPPEVRAQWEAQLDTALAVLATDASDLGQLQVTAVLEEQLGLYAEARAHMETLLERNKINPANWTIYGDIALKMQDYETAELAFAKSLELALDEQVIAKLEDVWRTKLPSQKPNIETLYLNAIAVDGQRVFYLVRLAQWYAEEGRWAEAASHLKVAADLEPENESLRASYEEAAARARQP